MNRKLLGFLLLATSILTLGGCSCRKDPDPPPARVKVDLVFKNSTVDTMIEINEGDILEKMDRHENYILVSSADTTCACWTVFLNDVINPYIAKTHVEIFYIDANTLDYTYYGLPIASDKSNTPVFGIYKDGHIRHKQSYSYENEVFSKLEAFEKYIEDRCNLPRVEKITLDRFQELLRSDTEFLINYGLSTCPDCVAYDINFLKDYIKTHKSVDRIPYYYIETRAEGMRLLNGVSNTDEAKAQWQAFKDNYGLSNAKNPEMGFNTGYVPTVQLIEGSSTTDYVEEGDITPLIIDMMVFQNDQLGKVDDKVVVTSSYYNGVRGSEYLGTYESLEGTVIAEGDYTYYEAYDMYVCKPMTRYEVHAPFAAKFLEYYWHTN